MYSAFRGYKLLILPTADYSQCIPGTVTSASVSTTLATSTRGTSTTTQSPSTTVSGGPGATGTRPGTTLQSGYYWIRAVEAPNFHYYLQTIPQYATGTAVLDSYTSAGQFQVVDGQLVELIDRSGTVLYANVEPRADNTVVKLAVTFSTTKNTYGTFAWSGDALTWSISSISRPNNAAWLVCANQQLFINLGSYAYNTPAGCADETVSFEGWAASGAISLTVC